MAAINEVIVAMVPFPDYSHLNQLFVLARFIASHNIQVHFLCFADENKDLKLRVQDDVRASNIHFDNLLRPSSPTEKDDRDGEPPILIYSSFKQTIPDIVDDDDDHEKLIKQMQDEFPMLEPHEKYCFQMELDDMEMQYSGEIINSCKEVEAFTRYSLFRQCIDIIDDDHDKMLRQLQDKQEPIVEVNELLESHDTWSRTTRPECLAFLDEQHVNSVMFVSFGTNTKFSQEQVNELMLGHKSTGGFLSHCGWNSCLESTSMGVHIAAWPNNADLQPYNAVFVTTKIGICVELGSEKDW
uniref:UDP-glucosyltransferase n=1 Tax=Solanum tuberosum TaxID=4113 RepID=M1ADJ1_SOLTU